MKVVKVDYMNDAGREIVVRILDSRYDPSKCSGDIYTNLKPCESKEFEVHMPDDATLWVKSWAYMVMLSYREQNAQQPLAQPLEGQQYEDQG